MRENIFVQIYTEYSSLIQSGQLTPGTKLPSESELAEAYNTSRETVRKALNLCTARAILTKSKAGARSCWI